MTPPEAVLEFYGGTGRTPQGHGLQDVWAFSEQQLESVHDYIQWLFPTSAASRYHPLAPILNSAVIDEFQSNQELTGKLLRSLERMLSFWGLELQHCEVAPTIREAAEGEASRRRWQTPGNHNLLRLTRVLDSLRELGLGRYSLALYLYLEAAHLKKPRRIPYESVQLWRRAAGLEGAPARAPGLLERLKAWFRRL